MATYRKADSEADDIIRDLLIRHYPDLHEVGVTVSCLFAYAPRNEMTGEPTGPALKWAGMPAAAVIKINSLKDRVAGLADATITVDGDQWKDQSDVWKRALLHHELEHLELRLDDEGNVQTDDAFRSKLKCRQHDFYCAGFWNIVEQYKEAALETAQYKPIHKEFTQRLLPYG